MEPDIIEKLKGRIEVLESAFYVFSDRLAVSKDIEMQRGRHISAVYAGQCNGVSGAGVFLPSGWTFTKNSTGNYTVTHNMNRTDYAVQLTFIDSNASGLSGIALAVTASANNFTVDLANNSFHFDHAFYFTVLI